MKLTQQLVGGSGAVIHAQIEFVRDGDPSRRDTSDALDVAFESVARVRTPASWKHKRNYEGLYWAATIDGHVWFDSLCAAVMRLDRDRDVVSDISVEEHQDFVVIAVDYRVAVLRSLAEDCLREVVIEELLRMPDVVWHELRPPATAPTDVQLLEGLPEEERQNIEAWAEHLEIVMRDASCRVVRRS